MCLFEGNVTQIKLIHILMDTSYMKESINRPINGRTFYSSRNLSG